MSKDLPTYSDVPLRTGLQFAALEALKGRDDSAVWNRADAFIGAMEGGTQDSSARSGLGEVSKEAILRVHSVAFSGRAGAGQFRTTALQPLYRGQDCAPPEYIEQSIDNLVVWLTAESFTQIHPIEQCALTITRFIDVWPFEFGN